MIVYGINVPLSGAIMALCGVVVSIVVAVLARGEYRIAACGSLLGYLALLFLWSLVIVLSVLLMP